MSLRYLMGRAGGGEHALLPAGGGEYLAQELKGGVDDLETQRPRLGARISDLEDWEEGDSSVSGHTAVASRSVPKGPSASRTPRSRQVQSSPKSSLEAQLRSAAETAGTFVAAAAGTFFLGFVLSSLTSGTTAPAPSGSAQHAMGVSSQHQRSPPPAIIRLSPPPVVIPAHALLVSSPPTPPSPLAHETATSQSTIASPPPPPHPPMPVLDFDMCLRNIRAKGLRLENTILKSNGGVWGGTCTCPDGQVYDVGDQGDFCASLACDGGTSGECKKEAPRGNPNLKRDRVRCGTKVPQTRLHVYTRSYASNHLDDIKLDSDPSDLQSSSKVNVEPTWTKADACIGPRSEAREELCFELMEPQKIQTAGFSWKPPAWTTSLPSTGCLPWFSVLEMATGVRRGHTQQKTAILGGGIQLDFEALIVDPPSPPAPPCPPTPPVPPPLLPPPPLGPAPSPPPGALSVASCRTMLQDPSHLMRQMWGVMARTRNMGSVDGCWNFRRDDPSKVQSAETFFDDIAEGRHCRTTNWYEGAFEAHGKFSKSVAPALLGFDQEIKSFCKNECDKASYNILNLFGGIPYNTCRNFEWQLCAALGELPGQNTRVIEFARAPKAVSMSGWPRFGTCSGYTNAACDVQHGVGFANDDIYYLEACLFSQVCSNNEELFAVEKGQDFICEVNKAGIIELQGWLTTGD